MLNYCFVYRKDPNKDTVDAQASADSNIYASGVPGTKVFQDNLLHTLQRRIIQLMELRRGKVPMPVEPPVLKDDQGIAYVTLGFSDSLKILLWNEMIEQKISSEELAKRLGIMDAQVDRLFQIGTLTGVMLFERALNVLGKNLNLSLSNKESQ